MVQNADQFQRNSEGNHFNQWRGKRERAQLWHSHNLSQKLSLSLSLPHSLSDPLCHSDTGLRQAMEILRLVGIKGSVLKNVKTGRNPSGLKTDMNILLKVLAKADRIVGHPI